MVSYSRSWRRVRTRFLEDNPTCIECGDTATVADHNPPRRQLVDAGIPNPDDPAWLQPLCTTCHNHKTATIDGGFGRETVEAHER